MLKLFISLVFGSVILFGCANAKIDANANVNANANAQIDANANINTQVEAFLKANLESMISSHTQNIGMFAGGGIYVVIVAIVFLILLFGTIIYLVKSLASWKKVWHLVSSSIEKDKDTSNLKSIISDSLEINGLKQMVDKNLEKRGLRKNILG